MSRLSYKWLRVVNSLLALFILMSGSVSVWAAVEAASVPDSQLKVICPLHADDSVKTVIHDCADYCCETHDCATTCNGVMGLTSLATLYLTSVNRYYPQLEAFFGSAQLTPEGFQPGSIHRPPRVTA